ncbi:hypothetical protein MIS45_02115 [Wielerella bovis]|nr:hypothetical protein [Wielerella bovis]ULJ69673.1 hypothetical protein MIS45_02115 [Wielerella bovis]
MNPLYYIGSLKKYLFRLPFFHDRQPENVYNTRRFQLTFHTKHYGRVPQ